MSATMTPPRSYEQRMSALVVANEVRARRADFKRHLRALDAREARWHALDLILHPPGWALTWRLEALLLAIPKVGPVKVARVLRRAGISPRKTIGGLSARQREEAARWLEEGP